MSRRAGGELRCARPVPRRSNRERGAAAVEFALILPALVLLILGIVEFGHLYNNQVSVTNAAREGARVMAITGDSGAATAAAIAAAPSLNPPIGSVAIAGDCEADPTSDVTVTINYPATLLTGLELPAIELNGRGVMLCGG